MLPVTTKPTSASIFALTTAVMEMLVSNVGRVSFPLQAREAVKTGNDWSMSIR